MANRIIIYQHVDFHALSDGWQLLLDGLNRTVPGSKMERIARLEQLQHVLSTEKQGILVVPFVDARPERLEHMQLELKKLMPFPFFFSIVFLLVEETMQKSSSTTALQNKWFEVLDSFYDQAIPVQFLSCSGTDADRHTFNISASLSSLLRQLDSLAELRKLHDAVADLESQMRSLQLGFSRP